MAHLPQAGIPPGLQLLPSGSTGQGASSVHQDAPAVPSGLMTLHWFVEPPWSTLGDDDALTRVLPGLLQGTLSFLVTGVNFLWKTGRRWRCIVKKTPNKDQLPQLSRSGVSSTADLSVLSAQ